MKIIVSFVPLCFLGACGWVDSTGRESNSTPVAQIRFDDGQQAEARQINELDSLRISASGSDPDGSISSYRWSDQPVEQGALDQCAVAPDFNMDIAANSLQEACAPAGSSCSLSIDRLADSAGDNVDFLITAPNLRAPVGVTYELTAIDNDGGIGSQRSTFCLIAINAAPDAENDTYTVLEGERLDVPAARGVLANDSDDDHVQNGALTVSVTPKKAPTLASLFNLRNDGGFTYVPLSVSLRSDASDSFEYWVTDGVHEPVSATVNVRIVAKDDPPEQLDDIPDLEAVPGIPFEFDISPYFEDPEGSTLSFAIVGGSLPRSGALVLSSNGVLSGTAELFDEGSYTISVAASDGSGGVTATINLDVLENLPVAAVSIPSQSAAVGEEITLDVSTRFDDPENQSLTYSVDTQYSNAELNMNARSGELTAEFDDAGRYTIDVSADDGVNEPSSIRFIVVVTLDNSSPIFRGSIANQTIDFGDSITPISGGFTDPDGDDLEFDVLGTLPAGVSISARGVITGRPTRSGSFAGIRIIATDPFGEFARSNAFTISVVAAPAAPANSAPVYEEDTVFNQGISLGQSIRAVTPEFSDPDGDRLSYSIIGGTLPAGVSINRTTGAVTGRPTIRIWALDLQVLATDPSGASAASDPFWIRVR